MSFADHPPGSNSRRSGGDGREARTYHRRVRPHAPISRAFVGSWRAVTRARSKAFSLLASGAFRSFGRRSVLQGPLRLSGERRMVIGDDVFVGSGSWLQVLDENGTGVAIDIGDGTSIAGSCVISAASSVRLGNKVLIARNVYISDHIHAYDDTTQAVLDQGVARIEAVEVGDGAWLGENVVVCPGVTVGRGAVVGANAVVTDDVPDYSLAVGAPARIVRSFAPPMELAS
jgi:acetyltransferase-like isoleucine patch superfamily enzyme